jgi:molybdopterin converting factor small subunit
LRVRLQIHFYSYFKELTGCAETEQEMPPGSTMNDLLVHLGERFPKLASMGKSVLTAVGVEYQGRTYTLQDGDEVSLFPPVQGG